MIRDSNDIASLMYEKISRVAGRMELHLSRGEFPEPKSAIPTASSDNKRTTPRDAEFTW
jgi:hypothetical protein